MDLKLHGQTRARLRLDERHRIRNRPGARARRRARDRQWPLAEVRRRGARASFARQPSRREARRLRRRPVAARGHRCARRAHPSVDVLVNNLGIFEPKPFEEIPDEDWRRFFDVNVLSAACGCRRSYLPGMKERNWGRIVFISSESGDSDSGRDDPLRHDEDRAARGVARTGGELRGHGRDRQLGAAGADAFGRRRRVRRRNWRPANRSTSSRRSFSRRCGRRR